MADEKMFGELSDEELFQVSGGTGGFDEGGLGLAVVRSRTGKYVALRSAQIPDEEYIVGRIASGEQVRLLEPIVPNGYTYVYAQCQAKGRNGKYTSKRYCGNGFVKSDCLYLGR